MMVENRKVGNVLVVKPLVRRIDASVASDFKGRMVDWINGGESRIVLDLAEVDFIDSSGLGAIVSALKAIGSHGDLVICNVKDTVMSLFQLTRMHRVFQIYQTPDEALRSFPCP